MPYKKYKPRSWAEIDLDALSGNLNLCRSFQPANTATMAVVKADAYGHGAAVVARLFIDAGVEYLGVAHCWEARQLAEAGLTCPIYILGPTFRDERREIVENLWTPCISDREGADHFAALASEIGVVNPLRVHLAVDTGMGRGGVLPSEALELAKYVRSLPNLELEGIGSHLPSADEDAAFTKAQMQKFESLISEIQNICGNLRYLHIANSAGLLDYPPSGCNLFRPGLMLYGISPIPLYQKNLTPVMTLKSRISIIRHLPAGHGVSYGRTELLRRDTAVATVGIGYGDGYPRSISGKGGHVFIGGHLCPILGRVTMDQIMIDLTDHPQFDQIHAGDEVELFGKNLLVSDVAEKADTIAWDILTGIMPRVQRLYV